MKIGKIPSIQAFNGAYIDKRIKFLPMIKNSVREIDRLSKIEDVEITPAILCAPDARSGIRVSAWSHKINPKYAEIDIFVPENAENIKHKAVLSAVKDAIRLVNA